MSFFIHSFMSFAQRYTLLSHSKLIQLVFLPLPGMCLPLPHELLVAPIPRNRRQILQKTLESCIILILSSMSSMIHGRHWLGHIALSDILLCISSKFLWTYSCETSFSFIRLQKPHSVTGLPSVWFWFLSFLLSCWRFYCLCSLQRLINFDK